MVVLGPAVTVPLNARLFAVVPDYMMGRVQSAMFLVGGSLYQFATLATGWLLEHVSPTATFAIFTGTLATVLLVCLLPGMRLPTSPEPAPAALTSSPTSSLEPSLDAS